MNPRAARLVALIKLHEGYRQHPYNDRGALSVGYGRNLIANGISEPEAEQLLINDLERVWTDLRQAVPCFDRLSEVRKSVLLDMAYNLGTRGLLRFARFLAAVNASDWPRAAVEMQDSAWWGQVGRRAIRLREMLMTDKWPAEVQAIGADEEIVPATTTPWWKRIFGD